MKKSIDPDDNQASAVFFIFCVWSVILLCRPQDYLHILTYLRPSLTMGIFAVLAYLLTSVNNERITNSHQYRLFICLVIVMALSVPFSYYRSASLKDVLIYASNNITFFFLFYQLVTSPLRLRRFLFACCCGAAVYALFVIILGGTYNDRIAFGSMFDPNDIAFFLVCFITFNLLFMSGENSFLVRSISLINVIICLAVILKSGSRSGFLACAVVFAYLLIVKTNTVKILFGFKVLIAIAFIIFLLSLNIISQRYKTILSVSDDYNVTAETGRITIWKIGIKLMLEKPLTGVGMNRFNEGIGRDREARGLLSTQWQSPHNSIIQIGAETGILGLVLFCLMSYKVFTITGAVKAATKSEHLLKLAEMTRAGFLGHMVCATFLGQAYSVYWIFYIVLSAVLQRMLEKEQLSCEGVKNESSLYSYAHYLRRS